MKNEDSAIAKHNCPEKFSGGCPAPLAAPEKRRPGAPKGNRNALRHGRRTREMDEFRAQVRAHIRETHALLKRCRELIVLREHMRRLSLLEDLTPWSRCPSN